MDPAGAAPNPRSSVWSAGDRAGRSTNHAKHDLRTGIVAIAALIAGPIVAGLVVAGASIIARASVVSRTAVIILVLNGGRADQGADHSERDTGADMAATSRTDMIDNVRCARLDDCGAGSHRRRKRGQGFG